MGGQRGRFLDALEADPLQGRAIARQARGEGQVGVSLADALEGNLLRGQTGAPGELDLAARDSTGHEAVSHYLAHEWRQAVGLERIEPQPGIGEGVVDAWPHRRPSRTRSYR